MQATPEQLASTLEQSLSHVADIRRAAESNLQARSLQPDYPMLLLQIVHNPSHPLPIAQAAAVAFKNFIKANWSEETGPISEQTREQVRTILVDLMLQVRPTIQKQLSATLTIISQTDFPSKWPQLLPALVSKLAVTGTPDWGLVLGVLRTIHSVMRRYRHQYKSTDVLKDLKYILGILEQPYFMLFGGILNSIEQTLANPAVAAQIFDIVRLLLKIFYTLNVIDLPEFFEDNMEVFMSNFRKLLHFQVPATSPEPLRAALLEGLTEDRPGRLHRVQALVCNCINLYIEKYEEEFQRYLHVFVQDVWNLVSNIGAEMRYDPLVHAALEFLRSVSTSVYYALFNDPSALQIICKNIVIPCMKLRQDDLEIFEDNPQEYIRRDMEGSDGDTRRRSALELVKGLRKHFEAQVTQIFSADIGVLLQQYASNPKDNWWAKSTAIYLVTSLAVRSATTRQGVSSTNELVPIMEFFTNQIVPELQNPAPASLLLKADALKFVTSFRQQLSKDVIMQLFPLLVSVLQDPNTVVHSYAANFIDRVLTIKDGAVPRFGKADIKPILRGVIVALFAALQFPGSAQNEYVMRAIMRTIAVAQDEMVPLAADCMHQLVAVLGNVVQNPTIPTFNHYMFECIAALVGSVGTAAPANITAFEQYLFPPFQTILQKDILEFAPYVFQIMSQLLELDPAGVTPPFQSIFPALVAPVLWERSGNVPALVRLLQAYLWRGRGEGVIQHIEPVLGVFQKLISSNATDDEAFYLLESIVAYVPLAAVTPHLPTIFTIIFTRLTRSRTPKFVRSFAIFLGFFVAVHGGSSLVQTVEKIQNGLMARVVDLWLQNGTQIIGKVERKIVIIALIKMLTETPELTADPFVTFWPRILVTLMQMLGQAAEGDTSAPEDGHLQMPAFEDSEVSFTNVFSQLIFAPKPHHDPLATVQQDPRLLLPTELHRKGMDSQAVASLAPTRELLVKLSEYYQGAGLPALNFA
eukprot:TRINITY_DN8430_c0_g1_i3.p1 TRINITY_DN8430_c0_g1~~TRINITY_DN8430_c0_g1_i3.p1  ORF type:complete len:991 (+),score=218.41 TRINITY_DN8430_c0_g1_i3:45-2975(+)